MSRVSEGSLLRVHDLKTWLQTEEGIMRAVDGLSFEIPRGQTFALVGESGCGKSMTALSIMKLLPQPAGRIVSGKIYLNGEELCCLPEVAMRRLRGGRISMIFQEPMTSLNPVLTVGYQIRETLEHHLQLGPGAAKNRAFELLDLVGIPAPKKRYEEYPHQLSGGMKQRVMIAMALSGEPELLIADEPTTALDVTIQAQILDLMRRLQADQGMAILLITHDLAVVSEMADQVAVMYAGQIIEMGKREVFFEAPRHPYSQKLFSSLPGKQKRGTELAVIRGGVPPLNQHFSGCRFVNRCEQRLAHCETLIPEWRMGASGGLRCHLETETPPSEKAPQKPSLPETDKPPERSRAGALLEVGDLKIHFPIHKGLFKRVVGHVKAVDGISLKLHAGRTLALVGESGCGKTSAGKGILQLIRPSSGSVRFDGTELTSLSRAGLRGLRRDFQIIFQDPYASLNPRMLIAEILKEGMIAQQTEKSEAKMAARIDSLLEQVGLPAAARNRYPHEFSGGQRQRICIARVLALRPRLIICDEPTSALDVSVQAQILNLLKGLQRRFGLAYLFITHDLSVVEYFAHEVAVMYLGRIVESGPVEAVLDQPKHPYTRALLSAVPQVDPKEKRMKILLEGDLPSPIHPPEGCHFHPRCPEASEVCRARYPEATSISPSRQINCHLYPS